MTSSPAGARGSALRECEVPLWDRYDLAMLDLDGVVYIGPDPVPDVATDLGAATDAGMTLAYVTNNASRPPRAVAEHLRRLGLAADADDVVTSAQAAARVLAERMGGGATVFVIGGQGLFEALDERGLVPTQDLTDEPAAVVSGYAPDLLWSTVIDGAILVRDGLPWVVSNTDLTVPTPHGPGPGNGVLVRAVAEYAGVEPVVAGKPEPPLFQETHRRLGGRLPLVVGDRLDTDIEGAVRAGYDSLLVLTGVTGLEELAAATPGSRPSYVAPSLAALGRPHGLPRPDGSRWRLDGWTAEVRGGRVVVDGHGATEGWLAAVTAAAWAHRDRTGEVADLGGLAQPTS
jgi:HAD superfamily hydrolase (TIGR01450 family)